MRIPDDYLFDKFDVLGSCNPSLIFNIQIHMLKSSIVIIGMQEIF
jgi:hypothetical protein